MGLLCSVETHGLSSKTEYSLEDEQFSCENTPIVN